MRRFALALGLDTRPMDILRTGMLTRQYMDRRFALTATTAITPMSARRMATTGRTTLLAGSLSALDRGTALVTVSAAGRAGDIRGAAAIVAESALAIAVK